MCRHQGADQSILAQGSECDNGTKSWSWPPPGCRVYLTPIHPWHSTTQGLALTTAQQQQLSWRTTTVREEQDWSDQIVRTAWLRCWQPRLGQ